MDIPNTVSAVATDSPRKTDSIDRGNYQTFKAEREGNYFGFVAMTILARGCEINVLACMALR